MKSIPRPSFHLILGSFVSLTTDSILGQLSYTDFILSSSLIPQWACPRPDKLLETLALVVRGGALPDDHSSAWDTSAIIGTGFHHKCC